MRDEELNRKHLFNPLPGDYWVERVFCGICVVLSVDPSFVTVCKTKRPVDHESWTWDLGVAHTLHLNDFIAWLRYDSSIMEGKTWCDVRPEEHLWAVEKWESLRLGETS